MLTASNFLDLFSCRSLQVDFLLFLQMTVCFFYVFFKEIITKTRTYEVVDRQNSVLRFLLFYLNHILFFSLCLLKEPSLYAWDRVFAETGSLYFKYAYSHGPWACLWHAESSYFDIVMNLSSALAVVLGLFYWPMVDIGIGLAVVCLLPWYLAKLNFSKEDRSVILLILSFSFYGITCYEIWGTCLHTKFWFILYSFFLLWSITKKEMPLSFFEKLCLVLLPMTGPPSFFVFAIFYALCWLYRQIRGLSFMKYSCVGFVVQLCSALLNRSSFDLKYRLLHVNFFDTLYGVYRWPIAWIYKVIFFQYIPVAFLHLKIENHFCWFAWIALFQCLWKTRKKHLKNDGWLQPIVLFSFFALSFFLCLFSLEGMGVQTKYFPFAERYFYVFVPLSLVCLWLFFSSVDKRYAMGLICLFLLQMNKGEYFKVDTNKLAQIIYNRQEGYLFLKKNDLWHEQVQHHLMSEKDHTFKTYPGECEFQLPDCGLHYCRK